MIIRDHFFFLSWVGAEGWLIHKKIQYSDHPWNTPRTSGPKRRNIIATSKRQKSRYALRRFYDFMALNYSLAALSAYLQSSCVKQQVHFQSARAGCTHDLITPSFLFVIALMWFSPQRCGKQHRL